MLNIKKKGLCQKVPSWEIYTRKELKLVKNPLATLEWITLNHTLSKKIEKQDQLKLLTKRDGVIFTYLTTRAIHIELAGNLYTDSFLLPPRRFISRRGYLKVMRSGNDTNFVGPNNELNLCIKQLDQIKLQRFSNHQNLESIFNPPASPWMGEIWESLVKSVKTGLKAILKDRIVTNGSLQIFLCEVESVLNRRPLTSISNDIYDLEPLTPNDLLIGEASPNQSPGNIGEYKVSLKRNIPNDFEYSKELRESQNDYPLATEIKREMLPLHKK